MNKLSIRAHLVIANCIMFIGGVITLVDMFHHDGKARLWMVGVGFIFVLIGLGYRTMTVRCPHCDDPLIGSWRLPSECPKCGHILKEKTK